MINWDRFKYKAKQNQKKRSRRYSSEDSDDAVTKSQNHSISAKRGKNDYISVESGSDDDDNIRKHRTAPATCIESGNDEENEPGSKHGSVFPDESTQDSLESPLLLDKKKKNFHNGSPPKLKNGKHRSSNGLGLSSSDSEGDDNESTNRKVFPRLSCGVANHSPVARTSNASDNNTTTEVKTTKQPKEINTSNHKAKSEPTAAKNIDDNFMVDDDDIESDFSDDDSPHFGKKTRESLFEFLQTAILDELITVEWCSRKKAEAIMSVRPFRSWEDLTKKMSTTKNLTPSMLYSCADLLKQRAILNRLLDECQTMSSILTSAIEKLHLSNNMTDGITSVKTPSIIPSHLKLKPYQLVGLNWMVLLHRQGVNGILADEMGLGKTVQTICFLAHLFEQDPNSGPQLIVVPSSTLGNWEREFNLWCPSMDVVLYQGSQPERRGLRVDFHRGRTADVIITTYNCAISTPEDRAFFRRLDSQYAIFDEGHMLKNMSSQRYLNLMKIKAKRKLLLTGTPLQNNLLELMSLLRFVMPHMFEQTTESLVRIFKHSNSESKSKYAKSRISDAKNIMQPFVLRRLKSEVLKQLPDKTVETVFCEMTDEQKDVYAKTKEKFRLGLYKQSSLEMKSAFTELRKAANHPLLRRYRYPSNVLTKIAKLLKDHDAAYQESLEHLIVEDLTVMTDFEIHQFCLKTPSIRHYALEKTSVLNSGKFKMLDTLLPDIKAEGEKAVIFSQWTMIIDIMEIYLTLRNYKFLRLDGSTPVNIRLNLIDDFESNPDITVFLLSTKAGGLGINLTAANKVILHDIDMNPHNDRQAEDRCHRLGQTKDVKITKLVTKDSIEEGMLKLAANKLKLEEQLSADKDDTADIATLIQNTLKS